MNKQSLQIDFQELKQKLEEIDRFLKETLWEELRKKASREIQDN